MAFICVTHFRADVACAGATKFGNRCHPGPGVRARAADPNILPGSHGDRRSSPRARPVDFVSRENDLAIQARPPKTRKREEKLCCAPR